MVVVEEERGNLRDAAAGCNPWTLGSRWMCRHSFKASRTNRACSPTMERHILVVWNIGSGDWPACEHLREILSSQLLYHSQL